MNDYLEIDLRSLVKNILSKWYWVVLAATIIGIGVFIYSYNLPNVFQVNARIALTDPPYKIMFEESYETNELTRPSEEVLKSLVLNDDIASVLFDKWESDNKENSTLRKFKEEQLSVTIGDKGMLVILTVKTKSRQNAAELVNTWADLAANSINSIYYGINQDQRTFFETQKSLVEQEFQKSAEDLLVFQTEENIQEILKNELDSLLASQNESLREIRSLETAKIDTQNLIDQLDFEEENALVDPSYRLSHLLIQSRVYSGHTWESAPVQLLVDLTTNSEEKTVAGFRTILSNWLNVIDQKLNQLVIEREGLSEEILSLQGEIQALSLQESELNVAYYIQKDVFKIVSTKNEEIRLTMPESGLGNAKIVSKASVPAPSDRLPHNTVRNTAIGIITGGFLGLAGVVIADWWKTDEKPKDKELEVA